MPAGPKRLAGQGRATPSRLDPLPAVRRNWGIARTAGDGYPLPRLVEAWCSELVRGEPSGNALAVERHQPLRLTRADPLTVGSDVYALVDADV
jgi:hypothetical protein